MAECPGKPDEFLVPAGSTGPIKPAKDPTFCLDAPAKGTVIQLFKCSESPKENLEWLMPSDCKGGPIKPVHSENKCVDVPGGRTGERAKLQQWPCTDKAR